MDVATWAVAQIGAIATSMACPALIREWLRCSGSIPLRHGSSKYLEKLPPGSLKEKKLEAEQRHIARLKSWMPEYGFNIQARKTTTLR